MYLPPGSAHPKNMLYSLVYGRLQAYRLQNTDTTDFIKMAKLLARRLISRGYSLESLKPVFQRAHARLLQSDPRESRNPVPTESLTTDDPSPKLLIFHLKYHPRGISHQQVRTAYSETLESLIPERHLIIAVSRPKNLKDRLCSTIL